MKIPSLIRRSGSAQLLLATWLVTSSVAVAADWPEWRGKGRLGVWREDGILQRFPHRACR